jgi:hypothetical protein
LHHLALHDNAGTEVYLSDRTGQVVRDTTRRERVWNWCGAALHWIYFTELRKAPAVWRQVVLWLAGVSIVSVLTGIGLGLAQLGIAEAIGSRPRHCSQVGSGLLPIFPLSSRHL